LAGVGGGSGGGETEGDEGDGDERAEGGFHGWD
jgi:hypothetical protein